MNTRIILPALAAAALIGCPPVFAQDKILAVVNREVITNRDLEGFMNFTRIQLSDRYSGAVLEEKLAAMKPDLVERLIEDRLILQEAKKENLVPDDVRIKAKINEIKKRYPTEREFHDALISQGLSEEDLFSRIREQMQMFSVIDRKIRSKIRVKPSEITDYYSKHPDEFTLPPSADVRSLSVENREAADALRRELDAGTSMDDAAATLGIQVNEFAARPGELKKEIEEILNSLQPGEYAGPLLNNGSYYIFAVTQRNPSRLQLLPEVQEKLSEFLYQQKMQQDMAEWLDELKKKAYIKIIE